MRELETQDTVFNMESLEKEILNTFEAIDMYEESKNLFLQAKEKASEMYTKAVEKDKESSYELSDVLHIIEMGNLSWWGRIKAYSMLLEVLKRRRINKDNLCLATKYKNKMIKTSGIDKHEHMFLQTMMEEHNDIMNKRTYSFRTKLVDIVSIKKGDTIKL